MDPHEIQGLLEEGLRRQYRVKVGEPFRIELPRVPLIGATQYLKLQHSLEDPNGTLEIKRPTDSGEGVLGPAAIQAVSQRAGRSRVLVSIANRLTGQTIQGTSPVAIEIEVEE